MSAPRTLRLGLAPMWWLLPLASIGGIALGALAAAASGLAWIGGLVGLVGAVSPLVAWVFARSRASAELLADGLVVRGGLRTHRVPYRDVALVLERVVRDEQYPKPAVLLRRSGGRIALHGTHGEVARVLHAIDAGVVRQAETRTDLPPLLVPGGRSTATWLRELEALGTLADTSFRHATFDRAEVLAVLEDPSADLGARAAAAALLRPALTRDERIRVRTAATSTLAPKLRVALEAIADESTDTESTTTKLVHAAGSS